MTALLWSLEQAGQNMGGLSARTIRRLIDADLLPAVAVRIPRRIKGGGTALGRPILMIRPEDARAYIARLAGDTDNPPARDDVPTQPKQEALCPRSRVSTKKTGIGGPATPDRAASELGALLGFPSAQERKERRKRKP